jgi:hypothetical protein
MAYTTILYLNTMMPKNVTIGNSTITTPTITQPQANTIATTTAQRYLNLATQWIDSRLRGIYICPLKKMKILEVDLTQTIVAGTNYLMVEDSGHFNLDSMVRVTDDVGSETYTVSEIFDNDRNKIGITPVTTRTYNLTNNPVVNLLEYPDPIPLICAQICIGMLFDKIYSTQQPDLSNFGKAQRTQGSNALDDILQGVIRLEGQDQTGRRFARSSLRDTISTTVEIQHSRDKEV